MSIWNLNIEKRETKKLENDKKVDILIIGAGITGLTTAYFLKNNKSLCVVDANIIGHGVTLGTTAKINYFQQTIYRDIKNTTGYENAMKYLKSQKESISTLKDIIKTEKIACDFKNSPSYVFASSKKDIEALEEEIAFLKENGVDVKEGKPPIDVKSYKSYYVEDTYTFNPIKYLYRLSNILKKHNIEIYENSKIISIEKEKDRYVCYGENYKIEANKVILACHYPFFLIPYLTPLKCSLEKSYMIISKVDEDKNITAISVAKPLYSCRFYNDGKTNYQISLARSHDLAYDQNDIEHFKRVEGMFKLKEDDIILRYTNSDMMTPDHMPYIGTLKENLYIGIGYNTWGMTNGVLAAKMISDEIKGIKNDHKSTFSPKRTNIQKLVKLPIYMFSNTKSFLGSKLYKNKKWYKGNVIFFSKDGLSLACYIDENGKKHIVKNKCPHVGCSLIFNEVEHTWDCPCHSSRFDIDGKCIKGPSIEDISYTKDEN